MSDIIERLDKRNFPYGFYPVMDEASAMIKRLRAEVESWVAEVEQLQAERDLWKERTHEGARIIEANVAEVERLRVIIKDKTDLMDVWRVEIERLRAGMREYACTATDHPCGCYEQFLSEKAEIERLRDERDTLRRDLAIWRRNGGDVLLRAEREELLEALRSITELQGEEYYGITARRIARKAIAKAEGK